MDWLTLIIKIAVLGGVPLAVLFGILRSKQPWPLTVWTCAGTAFSAINFRIAGSLADLSPKSHLLIGQHPGDLYRFSAWVVCPILLLIGIRKLLRVRAQQALAQLLAEDE